MTHKSLQRTLRYHSRVHFFVLICLQAGIQSSRSNEKSVLSFQQVKAGSPDYVDRDVDEAMEDFIQRIECYRANYMPIDDDKDRCLPMMLFFV